MKFIAVLLMSFATSSIYLAVPQKFSRYASGSNFKPIKTAERIVTSIIDGDRELNANDYFTKKEVKEFFGLKKANIPKSAIEKEIGAYNVNLKKFKKRYANNFKALNLGLSGCEEINWKNCAIDSTTFYYHILNHSEKDREIPWPKSKKYCPKPDQMNCFKASVFISEKEIQYVMKIEMWVFKNEAKFYHNLNAPRIYKIKQNQN